jgi:hypothetical protein
MRNLKPKPFAVITFFVFAFSVAIVSFATGNKVTDLWSAFRIGYKAIPLVLIAAVAFATYAWKWRMFRGWLVPFPDLNGTWEGVIETTWENPETGKIPGPIPVILSIKQSFVRISCVMRTAEMTSHSFLADFWLNGDEQIRMLGYSYRSDPLPSVRDRSHLHNGTVLFQLVGDPVVKLNGSYWTSRNSAGEIHLTFRERNCLEEFPSDLGEHPVSHK